MTPQNPTLLTGKQRSFLRALAHPLTPVVQIGHSGLTSAVLTAIDALMTKGQMRWTVAHFPEGSVAGGRDGVDS